jgi:hypothetical protein
VVEDVIVMSTQKLNNLKAMQKVADAKVGKNKNSYGIGQINTEFSPKSILMNDERAVRGKQILREKIYAK